MLNYYLTSWSVQVQQTFVPLDQETYSNIRYTGMGFIPEDYVEFHGNSENYEYEE